MPTPAERRALLFVAAVAALGVGVRGCQALRQDVLPYSDRESLARQIAAVDSAIASGGRRKTPTTKAPSTKAPPTRNLAAPPPAAAPENDSRVTRSSKTPALEPGSIDMDRAEAEELDRLPGIGPALAARIVADREDRGPFGSIEGLQRVKGIGPALAGRVQPYVTFSLPPRPTHTEKSALPAPARARRP